MKLHEIKTTVSEITGLAAFDENGAVSVFVTGDHPEMVCAVRDKLNLAGVSFTESKPRKFKGALFSVPVRNVGTAFAANWEFA